MAKNMTHDEALEWLRIAEQQDPRTLNPEELKTVLLVLFEASGSRSDPDVVRASQLMASVGLTFTVAIGPEGKPVVDITSEAPVERLDDTFTQRFFAAAQTAGVPQADAEIMLRTTLDQVGQFGGDPEGLLLPLIVEWESTEEQQRGRPIGVPEDFVAQRFGDVNVSTGFRVDEGGPIRQRREPRVTGVEPRYFDGDHLSPAGLPPEEIVRIQKRLERAGYLQPGSYVSGIWNVNVDSAAMFDAMADANASGRTVDAQIELRMANPEAQPQFHQPAFPKPDYATLAQDVKSVMRSKLGRDPSDDEMAELTGAMGRAYRAEFEAQVEQARAEFTGVVGPPTLTFTGQPPDDTLQDVDARARFLERFESRFGPEIGRLAALPETRENMTNVFSSLRTMSSLVG